MPIDIDQNESSRGPEHPRTEAKWKPNGNIAHSSRSLIDATC
jgi:hypothetical protein